MRSSTIRGTPSLGSRLAASQNGEWGMYLIRGVYLLRSLTGDRESSYCLESRMAPIYFSNSKPFEAARSSGLAFPPLGQTIGECRKPAPNPSFKRHCLRYAAEVNVNPQRHDNHGLDPDH